MDATHTHTDTITDPLGLIRRLDVESIREQLDRMDREREALLVLLRAARRAEPRGEVPYA